MRFARLPLLIWTFVLAWPAFASADGVVVEDFKGPSGKKARSVVVEILEDQGIVLIPPKKAKLTAKKSGADLSSESGRVRVANKLGIEAFISGTTKVVKRKTEIDIRVYRGSDGMESASFKTSATRWTISKELNKKLWAAIGPALGGASDEPLAEPIAPAPPVREQPMAAAPQRASPQRSPAPQPEQPWQESDLDDELPPGIAPREVPQARDDEGESEALAMETHPDSDETSTQRPSALDLTVGARIGTRSFGYNDSLPGLRGYSLLPSPSLALLGHWYPAAHFGAGALAHIGLDFRAEMLVGVSTQRTDDNQTFSTSSHNLGFGLRGRIPLDKLELGILGGWGQHAFSVSDNSDVDPEVPDIKYSFLRLGADGRYQVYKAFAVQLKAAFLFGLSLGELSSPAWFPHASGNGVELEAGFQLGISKLLAFELALGMQRYFMALNPEVDDPGVVSTQRVAGGALDKYFFSRLGLIIRP